MFLCSCLLCFLPLECPAYAAPADMNYDSAIYEEMFLLGEYEACISECTDAVQNLSDESRDKARYFLGLSYLKQGDLVKSREVLNILLDEGVSLKYKQLAYKCIADSYFVEGEYIHALNGYRAFSVRYPHSDLLAGIYYNYAESMLKRGQWIDARYYLQQVATDYTGSFESSYAKDILDENMFYYTVQVGEYTDTDKARKAFYKLKSDGFRGYLVEEEDNGSNIYKIRVGKLKTKNEGLFLLGRLKDAGYDTQLLP